MIEINVKIDDSITATFNIAEDADIYQAREIIVLMLKSAGYTDININQIIFS
jgi:hypothetical protein